MDDDERELDAALAALRREVAPPKLQGQLVERIQHRQQLERSGAARPWRPALILTAVAGAAAAGWFFGRLPQQTPISSETPVHQPRASTGTGARPAAATTSPLRVDPCENRRVGGGKALLLDDFEDGDDAIAPLEGRDGFWRWARETDAPGTAPALLPVPRGDGLVSNRLAVHVKGAQLSDWGATIELDFRPRCYDAASYAGVSFQARGPGRIYLAARETRVIPLAEGGSCESDCHNPHVVKVDLGDGFRSYKLRWSDLRQRGVNPPALDPSRLHSIAFLIRPEDTPYDVWVDDVSFVPAP